MTLEFVRIAAVCTVQDLGRRGHMHEAVPPGGALVPEWLVAANRRARNSDGAPAIEVSGRLTVRATTDILVATDREAKYLRAGEELTVESEHVTYLAIRGGVDAPRILDGRGALLCADGFGWLLGRGAVVRSAGEPEVIRDESPAFEPPTDSTSDEAIRVIAGPDLDAFASNVLDELAGASYRRSRAGNRVGVRLEGPALTRVPTYRERSRPMVIGALEVPGDGLPIVLGPEHPTTGGYPIVAVIATAELGRFFAIRPGGFVRFEVARR